MSELLEPSSSSSDGDMEVQSISVVKTDPFMEPEKKRVRLTSQSPSPDTVAKFKLEDRLGGILCCAVCLDLPKAAVYQVND